MKGLKNGARKIAQELKNRLGEGFKKEFREGYKKGLEDGSKGFVTESLDVFRDFLDIHNKMFNFAVNVNQASFNKYNPPSAFAGRHLLARSALYKIGERAVILHRGMLSLCEDGWVSIAPIIQRSLLECLINTLAIVKKDSEYMAFQFLSNEYLNIQVDKNLSEKIKCLNMSQVDKILKDLSGEDLKRAEAYIADFLKRGNPKRYWYRLQYSSAKDILQAAWYITYQTLSMSVHSNYIGMNLFKDQPDKVDINPRRDPLAIKSALVMSSRLLLEITNIRAEFEDLGFASEVKNLIKDILDTRKTLAIQDVGK